MRKSGSAAVESDEDYELKDEKNRIFDYEGRGGINQERREGFEDRVGTIVDLILENVQINKISKS